MFGLRIAAMVCVATGLSGCVENEALVAPPKMSPEVRLTSMGKSMPVERVVPVQVEAGKHVVSISRLISQHYVDCDFEASTFSMRIEEVGVYNLPVYGENTPPIKVTCNGYGNKRTQVFSPVKQTTSTGASFLSYPPIQFALAGPPILSRVYTSR